jgi:hypothetical protein
MDYREMTRLAQDPAGIRGIARMVMRLATDEMSEKSQSFLSDLEKYDGSKPLSTRQLETLYDLREKSTRSATAGGYSAATLFKRAYELRCELDEMDERVEWLQDRHSKGPGIEISKAEWRRLIALCKQLGVLPVDQWVEL